MTLDEIVQVMLTDACGFKEYVCRKGPRDIKAVIHVWRGNDLVAVANPAAHERDLIIRVFKVCAMAFDADAMSAVFESYSVSVDRRTLEAVVAGDEEAVERARRAMINPSTGQPWGPGEMENAVRNHGALEEGWLTECLHILAINRAGDLRSVNQPYRYAGGHLVLGEPIRPPAQMEAGGLIVDAVAEAMATSSIGMAWPYEPTEGSRAERDAWAAEMATQILYCQVAVVAGVEQRHRLRVLREHGFRFA